MAAEENKPEITKIHLANADVTDDCKSSGALYWAITNQMFRIVKSFIEKGYDLNEYYINRTPFGAALTCG